MTNDYHVTDDIAFIDLGKGVIAKIDAADLEKVKAFPNKWGAVKSRLGNPYGCGYRYTPGIGTGPIMLLHRFILDAPARAHVDHINHDTLDNRRSNLRLASRTLNSLNRSRLSKPHKDNRGKWICNICFRGQVVPLGMYETCDQAMWANAGARIVLMAIESGEIKP